MKEYKNKEGIEKYWRYGKILKVYKNTEGTEKYWSYINTESI